MSVYTEKMVAELQAFEIVTWADAQKFAEQYSISPRSVVSKVKTLQIPYEPKPKAEPKRKDSVRKIDTVRAIAAAMSIEPASIEGLTKADRRALAALFAAVSNG